MTIPAFDAVRSTYIASVALVAEVSVDDVALSNATEERVERRLLATAVIVPTRVFVDRERAEQSGSKLTSGLRQQLAVRNMDLLAMSDVVITFSNDGTVRPTPGQTEVDQDVLPDGGDDDDQDNKSSSPISAWIIGVGVGSVVLIALAVACFCRKHKSASPSQTAPTLDGDPIQTAQLPQEADESAEQAEVAVPEIDPDFLAEIPEELREEVLAQQMQLQHAQARNHTQESLRQPEQCSPRQPAPLSSRQPEESEHRPEQMQHQPAAAMRALTRPAMHAPAPTSSTVSVEASPVSVPSEAAAAGWTGDQGRVDLDEIVTVLPAPHVQKNAGVLGDGAAGPFACMVPSAQQEAQSAAPQLIFFEAGTDQGQARSFHSSDLGQSSEFSDDPFAFAFDGADPFAGQAATVGFGVSDPFADVQTSDSEPQTSRSSDEQQRHAADGSGPAAEEVIDTVLGTTFSTADIATETQNGFSDVGQGSGESKAPSLEQSGLPLQAAVWTLFDDDVGARAPSALPSSISSSQVQSDGLGFGEDWAVPSETDHQAAPRPPIIEVRLLVCLRRFSLASSLAAQGSEMF